MDEDEGLLSVKIIESVYDEVICPICGDIVEWELEPDPDNLYYFCTHKECGLEFTLRPEGYLLETKRIEEA